MYIWGRVGPRVGSSRVRHFVGKRGSGRVNVSPGRVGSGPRKVTRGQLCFSFFCTRCLLYILYIRHGHLKTEDSTSLVE